MPKDKQVYSFDEMMSLEECVKKAYYIDECKFLLNSELLDVEDRFRIFCLSNKKYIVKKSKIHKAKNEIEKAVEAEKRIDNLNILDKKIKVVVPQLIKHGCNGYLVSEYLGQTLQERVYSRKNNKIEFDVDFLFSVLETLLDKRVLYRGFLPRNTIVGKKTLYLIDWEDTVFIEQNEKPYISLLWETNFIVNWSYFYDQNIIETMLTTLCSSKDSEEAFPLLEYEVQFKNALNLSGDNKKIRESIKDVVLFAEREVEISKKHIPANDLAHLISDLFDVYVDIYFDVSVYNLRKKDEGLFSRIIVLLSKIIHFCYEEDLPIQPVVMMVLLTLIDDNSKTNVVLARHDFHDTLKSIGNTDFIKSYINNDNATLKKLLLQKLTQIFKDARFIKNLIETILDCSNSYSQMLSSIKYDKFFSSNKTKSIDTMKGLLETLAKDVLKYVHPHRAMLDGRIEPYKNFLDKENLPLNGSSEKEVIQQLSKYFQRAVQWEKAETMINITPPANLVSIACSAYASLFNPNFAQDEPSGYLLATELVVVKFLAQLVGWNEKTSSGLFTFGGKGICLYAGKIGLLKAIPEAREIGINNSNALIISNDKGHPCHIEISDWLGLGSNSCLRLPTDINGRLNLDEFEDTLRDKISKGNKIVCIILNGGTTNEVIIDPIRRVSEIRDKLVSEFKLSYIPHIHVDSVIGWAWLFYKHYDFDENKLGMSKKEQEKISSIKNKIQELEYADSFGVDFHKTGFCPYLSSCILIKDGGTLHALGGKQARDIDSLKLGEYSPFEYSLELSRPSCGPISAYTAMKLFGITGFQELIYRIFSNGEFIRSLLNEERDFEVINNETEGFATLFVILPTNKQLSYNDYIKLEENEIKSFLNYNHQFYLFLLEKYEEGIIGFRTTFSKSYKPYGAKSKTGCLKIYQTSTTSTRKEIKRIIGQLIELKKEFDNSEKIFVEQINRPIDFVYRGNDNESTNNT